MGRPTTDATIQRARDAFLERLAQGLSVTGAAAGSSFCRDRFYVWRKEDVDFSTAWDSAVEAGTDVLEDEARRRAYEGVEEPVIAMGRVARDDDGTILKKRTYSDTLLLATLKRRRPSDWRERATIDANIAGKLDHEHTADDAFLAVAAALGGYAARPASSAGDDGGLEGQGEAGATDTSG